MGEARSRVARRPLRGVETQLLTASRTLLAWALLTLALAAQGSPLMADLADRWRWRTHVRATDGMPRDFFCVRADDRGGLIVADEVGVWRFDGSRWRLLCPIEDMAGLQPSEILPLGNGWVVSGRTELLLLQPDAGENRVVRAISQGALVGRAAPRPDGSIVFGTLAGVFEISSDGTRFLAPPPEEAGDPTGYGLGLDGEPWCLSRRGIFRLVGDTWRKIPIDGSVRDEGDMSTLLHDGDRLLVFPRVFAAQQCGLVWDGTSLRPLQGPGTQGEFVDAATTPEGEVLLALRHNPLSVLEGETWRVPALPPGYDRSLKSVTATPLGRIAAVTFAGDLVVHDHASTRWQAFDPRPFGVSAIVNTLTPARDGGLWLGTHEGVVRFDGGHFIDPILRAEPVGSEPVDLRGITSVAEDDDGTLWVGSGQTIEGVLARRDGRWEHHVPPGMEQRSVHAMRRGPDGKIWMSLLSLEQIEPQRNYGGIVTWDGERFEWPGDGLMVGGEPLGRSYDVTWTVGGDALGAFVHGPAQLTPDGWAPLAHPGFRHGAKLFSVFTARDGTLWSGHDLWKPGIARKRPGQSEWTTLEGFGWAGVGAACFAEDARGELWFASESGLFRIAEGMCHRVRTEGVVSDNSFWALSFDEAGDLWLASMGGGLVRLETGDDRLAPRSDRITSHPTAKGRALQVSWDLADAWETSTPDQLSWRLRVDDGDWSDWSAPGTPPETTLQDLSTGEHTVAVMGMDAWGNIEPEPVTATVTMPRTLMQQPAMQLAVSLGIISVVVLCSMVWRRRRELAEEAHKRSALNDRLRELTALMMHAEEKERRRLARELHDDLGQLLTVTCMNLEQGLDEPDLQGRERAITRALSSATRAVESARSLARRVRHTALDDLGLEAAVRTTLSEFAETPALRIEYELSFEREQIPDPPVSHIYRILQESLTNVVRHAEASQVFVGLSVGELAVDLVVRDNGIGFDTAAGDRPHGLGLLGMRERAEAVDGRFSLESSPGRGTVVEIHIPLPPDQGP